MKIEKDQKDYVVKAFHSMRDRDDFVKLLNYAKKIIYGEKTVFFDLRQLTYYSNPNVNFKRYKSFEIAKKNGKSRKIHAPVKGLLVIQKCLNLILNCIFQPTVFATGFVMGKSIVDNAAFHAGNYYVYNIDLKDFFHSVDQARVWKCLQLKPISLSLFQNTEDKKYNSSLEIVNIISALTCTELLVTRTDRNGKEIEVYKNVLPQGAPTSPLITNLVCQKLDYLLSATAKRFGLKYSRYADDITFSSLHNVYQQNSDFLIELNRIIKDQGFVINEEKVRLQKDGFKQIVTGLVVNKHPNVSKSFIDNIKIDLYYWEHYGYAKATKFFLRRYKRTKGSTKTINADMSNVICGRLQYLKMIKGATNKTYTSLALKYQKLLAKKQKSELNPEDVHFKSVESSGYDLTENGVINPDLKTFMASILNSDQIPLAEKQEIFANVNLELSRLVNNDNTGKNSLGSSSPINSSSVTNDGWKSEHSPKDVARFMSLFNKRDGLKYLTHDFDEEGKFEISFFLEKWRSIFEQSLRGKNGFEIPSSLYRIVNEFAFSSKPNWTSVNDRLVNEGWSTDKWIKWSSKNMLHPFRNTGLKVIIEDFRRLIRVESPNLEFLVNEAFSDALIDENNKYSLKLDQVSKADFYTHIPSLKRALFAIFSAMGKYGGDRDITVSYQRSTEDDFFVRKLIISQTNSYPTKELEQILIEWNTDKGAMGGIKHNLYGYCDWSIETKIDNTPYRINILKDKKTPKFDVIGMEEIIGFKHILKFYYI